ncbi:hypothetical protein C8R44DRAFT_798266 [Mycena epipterygia]|nr:hypothetical protein C8R44DRAFT_798266 [Mycena epipterygia]
MPVIRLNQLWSASTRRKVSFELNKGRFRYGLRALSSNSTIGEMGRFDSCESNCSAVMPWTRLASIIILPILLEGVTVESVVDTHAHAPGFP